jgi:hypothetical protein
MLMATAELAEGEPGKIVFLSQLMERTGMTADQATITFRWMVENGFCDGRLLSTEDARGGKIFLTVKGMDEVERLRLPFWKRLFADPAVRAGTIAGLISGLIAGAIANIIAGLVMKML